MRSHARESGGSQRARSHLLFSQLHSLFLSPSHSRTQVVFSSKLAADTPPGAVSCGEEGGRKPEPSYLGKQAEAAKAADDTVYLWQPRPLPAWLGRDRRRETQTQRMHDYYIWLLFLGNRGLRTTLLVEEERPQTSSKPLLNQALLRRLRPLVGLPAQGASLLQNSTWALPPRKTRTGLANDKAAWQRL